MAPRPLDKEPDIQHVVSAPDLVLGGGIQRIKRHLDSGPFLSCHQRLRPSPCCRRCDQDIVTAIAPDIEFKAFVVTGIRRLYVTTIKRQHDACTCFFTQRQGSCQVEDAVLACFRDDFINLPAAFLTAIWITHNERIASCPFLVATIKIGNQR